MAGGPSSAVALQANVERRDLAELCARVGELAIRGVRIVPCDVTAAPADALTVDALARMQLAAAAHGGRLRLTGASKALLELVNLMGLRDVLRA